MMIPSAIKPPLWTLIQSLPWGVHPDDTRLVVRSFADISPALALGIDPRG
jgi:hypothetical protein